MTDNKFLHTNIRLLARLPRVASNAKLHSMLADTASLRGLAGARGDKQGNEDYLAISWRNRAAFLLGDLDLAKQLDDVWAEEPCHE